MDSTDRITAPIGEFCRLAGIGRSLTYEMIGDGRLESILIGKRRLILLDSYRQLIERQLTAASANKAAARFDTVTRAQIPAALLPREPERRATTRRPVRPTTGPSPHAKAAFDACRGTSRSDIRRSDRRNTHSGTSEPIGASLVTEGTDDRCVKTADIRAATRGRETEILDTLGIPWRTASRTSVPPPRPPRHNPSWRWDERKGRAICTCGSHSIFDVLIKVEGIDFDPAKSVRRDPWSPDLIRSAMEQALPTSRRLQPA